MGKCFSKTSAASEPQPNPLHASPAAEIAPPPDSAKHAAPLAEEQVGNMAMANSSYGPEDILKTPSVTVRATSVQSQDAAEPNHLPEGVENALSTASVSSIHSSDRGSKHEGADADDQADEARANMLDDYKSLAEMLNYSPYPVTLIDIESSNQPFVFVNHVFLKNLGYEEEDVLKTSWTEFLKTPHKHETHSDVQERIREAFETGCEFREHAACHTKDGDTMILQLLFLPVSKDVDAGVTHYVCIHVASELEPKDPAAVQDPETPTIVPKLPKDLDNVPTARLASVIMRGYTPEQILAGLGTNPELSGLRVGSFNGMPISPAMRAQVASGSSRLNPSASPATPPKPQPPAPAAAAESKKGAARRATKSRFAPAGSEPEYTEADADEQVLGPAPLGNLRKDSALMGAITSAGKVKQETKIPRTKEEVWLSRLRNLLTSAVNEL